MKSPTSKSCQEQRERTPALHISPPLVSRSNPTFDFILLPAATEKPVIAVVYGSKTLSRPRDRSELRRRQLSPSQAGQPISPSATSRRRSRYYYSRCRQPGGAVNNKSGLKESPKNAHPLHQLEVRPRTCLRMKEGSRSYLENPDRCLFSDVPDLDSGQIIDLDVDQIETLLECEEVLESLIVSYPMAEEECSDGNNVAEPTTACQESECAYSGIYKRAFDFAMSHGYGFVEFKEEEEKQKPKTRKNRSKRNLKLSVNKENSDSKCQVSKKARRKKKVSNPPDVKCRAKLTATGDQMSGAILSLMSQCPAAGQFYERPIGDLLYVGGPGENTVSCVPRGTLLRQESCTRPEEVTSEATTLPFLESAADVKSLDRISRLSLSHASQSCHYSRLKASKDGNADNPRRQRESVNASSVSSGQCEQANQDDNSRKANACSSPIGCHVAFLSSEKSNVCGSFGDLGTNAIQRSKPQVDELSCDSGSESGDSEKESLPKLKDHTSLEYKLHNSMAAAIYRESLLAEVVDQAPARGLTSAQLDVVRYKHRPPVSVDRDSSLPVGEHDPRCSKKIKQIKRQSAVEPYLTTVRCYGDRRNKVRTPHIACFPPKTLRDDTWHTLLASKGGRLIHGGRRSPSIDKVSSTMGDSPQKFEFKSCRSLVVSVVGLKDMLENGADDKGPTWRSTSGSGEGRVVHSASVPQLNGQGKVSRPGEADSYQCYNVREAAASLSRSNKAAKGWSEGKGKDQNSGKMPSYKKDKPTVNPFRSNNNKSDSVPEEVSGPGENSKQSSSRDPSDKGTNNNALCPESADPELNFIFYSDHGASSNKSEQSSTSDNLLIGYNRDPVLGSLSDTPSMTQSHPSCETARESEESGRPGPGQLGKDRSQGAACCFVSSCDPAGQLASACAELEEEGDSAAEISPNYRLFRQQTGAYCGLFKQHSGTGAKTGYRKRFRLNANNNSRCVKKLRFRATVRTSKAWRQPGTRTKKGIQKTKYTAGARTTKRLAPSELKGRALASSIRVPDQWRLSDGQFQKQKHDQNVFKLEVRSSVTFMTGARKSKSAKRGNSRGLRQDQRHRNTVEHMVRSFRLMICKLPEDKLRSWQGTMNKMMNTADLDTLLDHPVHRVSWESETANFSSRMTLLNSCQNDDFDSLEILRELQVLQAREKPDQHARLSVTTLLPSYDSLSSEGKYFTHSTFPRKMNDISTSINPADSNINGSLETEVARKQLACSGDTNMPSYTTCAPANHSSTNEIDMLGSHSEETDDLLVYSPLEFQKILDELKGKSLNASSSNRRDLSGGDMNTGGEDLWSSPFTIRSDPYDVVDSSARETVQHADVVYPHSRERFQLYDFPIYEERLGPHPNPHTNAHRSLGLDDSPSYSENFNAPGETRPELQSHSNLSYTELLSPHLNERNQVEANGSHVNLATLPLARGDSNEVASSLIHFRLLVRRAPSTPASSLSATTNPPNTADPSFRSSMSRNLSTAWVQQDLQHSQRPIGDTDTFRPVKSVLPHNQKIADTRYQTETMSVDSNDIDRIHVPTSRQDLWVTHNPHTARWKAEAGNKDFISAASFLSQIEQVCYQRSGQTGATQQHTVSDASKDHLCGNRPNPTRRRRLQHGCLSLDNTDQGPNSASNGQVYSDRSSMGTNTNLKVRHKMAKRDNTLFTTAANIPFQSLFPRSFRPPHKLKQAGSLVSHFPVTPTELSEDIIPRPPCTDWSGKFTFVHPTDERDLTQYLRAAGFVEGSSNHLTGGSSFSAVLSYLKPSLGYQQTSPTDRPGDETSTSKKAKVDKSASARLASPPTSPTYNCSSLFNGGGAPQIDETRIAVYWNQLTKISSAETAGHVNQLSISDKISCRTSGDMSQPAALCPVDDQSVAPTCILSSSMGHLFTAADSTPCDSIPEVHVSTKSARESTSTRNLYTPLCEPSTSTLAGSPATPAGRLPGTSSVSRKRRAGSSPSGCSPVGKRPCLGLLKPQSWVCLD